MTKFNPFVHAANLQSQEAERSQVAAANKARAMASISVLRTISKVVSASLDHTTVINPEQTEARSRALIEAIGKQSLALHEKLGSVNDPRMLPSLTGSVTTVLQALYRNGHEPALSVDVASLLADCADMPGIWKEEQASTTHGSLGFRRTITVMQAVAPVLAAYHRFDYYHAKDSDVLQQMQDLLWGTVEDTLNRQEAVQSMDEAEVELLRRNLMLRAGELLASAWDAQTMTAKAHVAESTPDERRSFKTFGYPLDPVIDLFRASYSMLERSFEVTLNSQFAPMNESEEDYQAPSPG